MTPPMVDWTDDEREAVINAMYGNGRVVPHSPTDILDALAPFVAERERQAAARALRDAAGCNHEDHWTDIALGGIDYVRSWLLARAERIERDDKSSNVRGGARVQGVGA